MSAKAENTLPDGFWDAFYEWLPRATDAMAEVHLAHAAELVKPSFTRLRTEEVQQRLTEREEE